MKYSNYNEGYGILSQDFRNDRTWDDHMLFDQLIASMCQYYGTSGAMLSGQVYRPQPSMAKITPSFSTARQVSSSFGTIFIRKTSNVPPVFPERNVDGYAMPEGMLETQLAVGDATHPRFDLIAIRIVDTPTDFETVDYEDEEGVIGTESYYRSTTKTLEKIVVQGTPAANPAMPNTPDGYAAWAAVRVPANHNAIFTYDMVYDLTMPMKVRNQFADDGYGGTSWSRGASGSWASINTTNPLWFYAPCGFASRILAAYIYVYPGNHANFKVETVRQDLNVGTPITAIVNHGKDPMYISYLNDTSAGGPIYGSGYHCIPIDTQVGALGDPKRMAIRMTAGTAGDAVIGVEWVIGE